MKGFIYSYLKPFNVMVVLICTLISILMLQKSAGAIGEFTTSWKTNVDNPADSSITIPTHPSYTYNYTVDWGDGNSNSGVIGTTSHVYTFPGTYTVKISGLFPSFYMNNHADRNKLIAVESWGNISWRTMVDAFEGAANLDVTATDVPDLTNVTSLNSTFSGASSMNGDISGWDVSKITDFSYLFYDAQSFNKDIASWNVSSAQTFSSIFDGAKKFNQNINSWNISNVTSFNSAFNNATAFNQPLDNWDTLNVQDTRYMFRNAKSFNQDVSNWNFPKVTRMDYMFNNANAFDQDISDWDIKVLQRAAYMFTGSNFSSSNFDKMLVKWANGTILNDVYLHVDHAKYCNGKSARNYLTETKGWIIFDSGEDSTLCAPTDIIFTGSTNLPENLQENTVIGSFTTVDPDDNDTHTYSLICDGSYPDSAFFEFNNNQLLSLATFSFNQPLDFNSDNTYDICITSQDSTGHSTQKEFTITVTEEQKVIVEEGKVLGESTGGDTKTTASKPAVLGDSTSVLAKTGLVALAFVLTGASLVGTTILLSKKKQATYRLRNN